MLINNKKYLIGDSYLYESVYIEDKENYFRGEMTEFYVERFFRGFIESKSFYMELDGNLLKRIEKWKKKNYQKSLS